MHYNENLNKKSSGIPPSSRWTQRVGLAKKLNFLRKVWSFCDFTPYESKLPTALKRKKPSLKLSFFAVWTGLEPATPCVTGRYSNQLNYQTVFSAIPDYRNSGI